jgi:hypothetical protein
MSGCRTIRWGDMDCSCAVTRCRAASSTFRGLVTTPALRRSANPAASSVRAIERVMLDIASGPLRDDDLRGTREGHRHPHHHRHRLRWYHLVVWVVGAAIAFASRQVVRPHLSARILAPGGAWALRLTNVFGVEASFRPDCSCRLTDAIKGTESSWASVEGWAADWFAEWRSGEHDEACEFIQAACGDAVPGVVDALIVLAETAGGDPDLLSWVGAGPLEDLISHSGKGFRALSDVDRAARENSAFRAALGNVWLDADVPETVRIRLAALGAWVLTQG